MSENNNSLNTNTEDQLENLINNQAAILSGQNTGDVKLNVPDPSDADDTGTISQETSIGTFKDPMDDLPEEKDIKLPNSLEIDYGDNDLKKEMDAEDEAERIRLENMRLANAEAAKNLAAQPKAPPNSLDPEYQVKAITFQAEKFTTLTEMVEAVKTKHGIKTEEIHIPESQQRMLAGELIDIYHNLQEGDLIPKEFEDMILRYWIKGSKAEAPPPYITEKTTNKFVPDDMDQKHPIIQINVPAGTPVTVNVDKDLVAQISKSKEIIVNVREVDTKDIGVFKVVENSNDDKILEIFNYKIGDTPITLLSSAYRCTMAAVNWGKIMDLSSPSGDNQSDMERKQWSVIYEQVKNVSIGGFKETKVVNLDKTETVTSAFENFLKATAYKDREMMMWAILVSTSKEQEELELTCVNRKCRHQFLIDYSPRGICHIDIPEGEKRLRDLYNKTNNAAAGDEALAHWNDVRNTRRVYQIPDSDWYVEIAEPDAFTYINHCLPLLQNLYERYRPGEKFYENTNLEEVPQFGYLTPHVIYVKSFSKVIDGTEYRFTNWEAIENILINKLSMTESNIVLKLIEKFTTKSNPISFYFSNVVCPKCQDKREKLMINNIGETLLFHLSQRQLNMPIEIVEMP